MVKELTKEETKALHNIGVFDCYNAGQLIQREDILRKLYRKKALNTHPDRAMVRGVDPTLMREAFQNVNESYQLLMKRIILHKGISSAPVKKVRVQRERKDPPHKTQSVAIGYYKGRFPERKLRFAEYLYYQQRITWEQLVSALSWQFINRPKLGELARDRGYLTNQQISQILKNKKSTQRFGLVAVKQGYISVDHCRELLSSQKKAGLPIGKYFIEKNILSTIQLNNALGQFMIHNNQFRRSPVRS